MDLIENVNLNAFVDLVDENLAYQVPIKIWANGDTGELRIYDPTDPDLTYYYYFYLPTKNLKGDWISLRTNGLKVSFGYGY
jgi:hypothetical protein